MKIKVEQRQIEGRPDVTWNAFVDFSFDVSSEIKNGTEPSITQIQKNGALCLCYHSEMCSGGHSGYFDCYPDINPQEMSEAMKSIGALRIAGNFLDAQKSGATDDYQKTDDIFFDNESDFMDMLKTYLNVNFLAFFEVE